MVINDKFYIHNAKSKSIEDHDKGDVPFVSNGFYNNGIIGFVDPIDGERVFNESAVCVSAFCEATVQKPPFLPRGNGGSGLIVLIPKEKMTDDELYFYAAQINHRRWRFSYGRMVTGERLADWLIIEPKKFKLEYKPEDLLPKTTKQKEIKIDKLKEIPLTQLCYVERKYAPYMNQIDPAPPRTPYVTTTEENNGISIYCNEDPNFSKGTVSISLDGSCGTAFYQFDNFISGEKTAVLRLKGVHDPFLLFYIAAMVEIRSWRYHYGRKLSMGRLTQFSIPVPVQKDENVDYKAVRGLVLNGYGAELFEKYKN